MKKYIILSVFAALLTGCAIAPSINQDFVTEFDKKTGIVMFSFTKTGRYRYIYSGELEFKCSSNTYGNAPDGIMFVKYLDGGSPDIPISADLEIKKDRPLGMIHLLELPVGSCEFTSYTGTTSNMTTRTTLKSKPFLIKFEVTEGRTTYIGNFNADWNATGPKFSYKDQFERDLAILKKRSPDLAAPGPEKKIAKIWSWYNARE